MEEMSRQDMDSCRYGQVEMLIRFLHGSRTQGGCSHSDGSPWSRTNSYDQVDMLIERLQSSDSEHSLPSSDCSTWSQSTMTVNATDKRVDDFTVYGDSDCCEGWYDSVHLVACKSALADPLVSQTSWRADFLAIDIAPSAHCRWPETGIKDTHKWKLNTPATVIKDSEALGPLLAPDDHYDHISLEQAYSHQISHNSHLK